MGRGVQRRDCVGTVVYFQETVECITFPGVQFAPLSAYVLILSCFVAILVSFTTTVTVLSVLRSSLTLLT